jgi:hypothetical protein
MYSYFSGLFIGFLTGFVSGYSFNFCINVYKNYKTSKNKSKAMAQELFNIYSKTLFENIYDELETNNIQLPELGEIVNISNDISDLLKDYNKSFKIVIKKGVPVIQLIDNKYIQNKKVVRVLEFLNKNEIEITINKNDKPLKIK